MLDHVSITVSDLAAAERFYDAIMKVLDVVKVGRRDDWLGYGERARPAHPERVYISIRKGAKPDDTVGRHWCFKARWRTQVDAFWDAGIPERIDLGAPPRLEAPMATDGIVRLRAFADRDINPLRMCRPGALAVAEPVVAATDLDDIKHLHDRVVETLGGREIGYGDRNVVEHG